MKLLTIVVPSYNAQDYLRRCLDSLIPGGPDVEVIIVDDGSTDQTAAVAREYIDDYPAIFRLEQKENGGHGSAVNHGLKMAAGRYFKVVDSDDWVDGDAFRQVLDCLRKQEASDLDLDALVVNYVYEYFYNGTQRVVNYSNAFKHDQDFGWERLRRLTLTQLLGMHSLIHRTDLLRSCGVCLPEHTFYVDSLLVYKPMPYIRRIHYLNVDFYRYFIGRADQSVNSAVLIQRVDQHIRVAMALVTMYPVEREIKDPDLRRYMYRFQSMLVSITIIHLILAGDDQSLAKIGRIWQDIRQYDEKVYRIIRRSFISRAVSIPGRGGRFITRKGFGVVRKILKFS